MRCCLLALVFALSACPVAPSPLPVLGASTSGGPSGRGSITIDGAVQAPGVYAVRRAGVGLVGALVLAKGLQVDAAPVAVVWRADGSRLPVDLARIADGEPAVVLRPGDTLVVGEPVAPMVHVQGRVARAGRYALRPGMTAMDAIDAAGGVVGEPRWLVVVVRGRMRRVADIRAGRRPDVRLEAGDWLLVGPRDAFDFWLVGVAGGARVPGPVPAIDDVRKE